MYEEVPCNVNVDEKNLEGCGVCRRRISDSSLIVAPLECIKALDGYQVCNIGERIRACYVDTLKYSSNNIQPLPFCTDYSFTDNLNAPVTKTLTCKACALPYTLDKTTL